jgi:hypothetical protein
MLSIVGNMTMRISSALSGDMESTGTRLTDIKRYKQITSNHRKNTINASVDGLPRRKGGKDGVEI